MKQMFSALRKRIHLSPATVIASLALVFAMTGGAYAAKKFLVTSTKQISPSVLKALKGKAGPAGPAGAPGAAGPAGPAGPAGAAGSGTPGAPGAPGTSVTGEAASAGECPSGGEKYTSASGSVPVCNGKAGKEGKEGSPWTAGGTLPVGSTETGAWAVGPVVPLPGPEFVRVPVASFAIPLADALKEGHAHFINEKGKEEPLPGEELTSTICLGSASDPKATSGNLCVYAASAENILTGSVAILNPAQEAKEEGAAAATGATMDFRPKAAGQIKAEGTWAVTG